MNKTKRRKQKTRTRRINKSRKNTVKNYNTLTSGGGDTAKLIILLEKLKKNIVNGQIDNVDQEFSDVITKINSLFGGLISGRNETARRELRSIEVTDTETVAFGTEAKVSVQNDESEKSRLLSLDNSAVKHYNSPNLISADYDCKQEYKKMIAAYNAGKLNNKMEGFWKIFGYGSREKNDAQKQVLLKMSNYRKKTTELIDKLFELIKVRSNYKCEKQHAPLTERLKRVPLWNLFNQEDNTLFEYWAFFARLLTVINNENKINPSLEELEERRVLNENIRLKQEELEKEATSENNIQPDVPSGIFQ